MSDFESFSGFDANEGSDPAAFERFKERMKAASAQLKAIQAGEQKQKKKEDELIKILLKFIQSGQNRDVLLLISHLLEDNVPAGFIVALIAIAYEEIQNQIGLKLLPEPDDLAKYAAAQSERVLLEGTTDPPKKETLPDHYMHGEILPLKIKIAIDAWVQEIFKRASENPHRIIKTGIDQEGNIKLTIIQLATFCLRDFMESQTQPAEYDRLRDFMQIMLQGIFKKLEEMVKNQKELRDGI